MCVQKQQKVHKLHYLFPQKRRGVRVLRLSTSRRRLPRVTEDVRTDMELENLKLYMENMNIIQENEKLRKQAHLLHQENLILMSEFRKMILKSVSD